MPVTVRSYSKINLGLAVGPARADGFHGLTTMYQTLALHDLVTVTAVRAAATEIVLTADHPGVPRTETGDAARNTAWVMVAGALERMGVTASVTIDIQKKLPVQGGMGAGSANAAAALIGLERELGMALPAAQRLELAAAVGSDVPLFLLGGTVLGLGRGEQVFPLPDLPRTWCVVAVPAVGVSTKLAFAELDRRSGAPEATAQSPAGDGALTFAQGGDRLTELSRVLAGVYTMSGSESGPTGIGRTASPANGSEPLENKDTGTAHDLAETQGSQRACSLGWESSLLALVRTGIENDFEEVAFSQHPFLRDILRQLMGTALSDQGEVSGGTAMYAALSGSGSALFGLYANRAEAEAAQQRVQQAGTEAILTETLPRAAYWSGMFEQ